MSATFWDPVVEKIGRKLDEWKKTIISSGGRLTLVHFVLQHILIYYLSLFKMHCLVVRRIEGIMRDFLMEGSGEGKKGHLVSWNVVTCQKLKVDCHWGI
ncbi:unnamed protein product [Ilex paraguariensis]|uniref:Uncharacterized protein n=1 Tax=Ilex paraguariensis TaxID=185542 RepID=A0ABC8TL06_9AQUA